MLHRNVGQTACVPVRLRSRGQPAQILTQSTLRRRGHAKLTSDGSVQLLTKDYPYAEDGMLIWKALEKMVSEYVVGV